MVATSTSRDARTASLSPQIGPSLLLHVAGSELVRQLTAPFDDQLGAILRHSSAGSVEPIRMAAQVGHPKQSPLGRILTHLETSAIDQLEQQRQTGDGLGRLQEVTSNTDDSCPRRTSPCNTVIQSRNMS